MKLVNSRLSCAWEIKISRNRVKLRCYAVQSITQCIYNPEIGLRISVEIFRCTIRNIILMNRVKLELHTFRSFCRQIRDSFILSERISLQKSYIIYLGYENFNNNFSKINFNSHRLYNFKK